MAVAGTIIPCKDAKFTFDPGGGPVEVALDDATLRGAADLVDVSTNVSQGWDELVACFQRLTVDCSMPWRVQGWTVTMGATFLFTAQVVPITVLLSAPVMIESIDVMYKAKDVWRVRISAKSYGPASFALPGP
jgi:hypothetical protein